jgi:hypothetical protein
MKAPRRSRWRRSRPYVDAYYLFCPQVNSVGDLIQDSRGVFYLANGRIDYQNREIHTGLRKLRPDQLQRMLELGMLERHGA